MAIWTLIKKSGNFYAAECGKKLIMCNLKNYNVIREKSIKVTLDAAN